MSCSKPLPPFVCDSLYYLNRNQLERFLIVCHPLKNFIERYLHSKPYRVFDQLSISGGLYVLFHNHVRWHPNRDYYTAQQFSAGEALHLRREYYTRPGHYSFAEMRPYLDQTVRIKKTSIHLDDITTYNPEHIEEMESIAHLWCDRAISVSKGILRIVPADIQPILDSSTILQCQYLCLFNAHFSFKDYKVLYSAKIIEIGYIGDETDPNYWPQFLEQPGAKPLVVLRGLHRESINTVLDHLSQAFSSAVSPNAFRIVFAGNRTPLTEFRETNKISGEKLELALLTSYQDEHLNGYFNYVLERSSI